MYQHSNPHIEKRIERLKRKEIDLYLKSAVAQSPLIAWWRRLRHSIVMDELAYWQREWREEEVW